MNETVINVLKNHIADCESAIRQTQGLLDSSTANVAEYKAEMQELKRRFADLTAGLTAAIAK